jgi:hypothetical protein
MTPISHAARGFTLSHLRPPGLEQMGARSGGTAACRLPDPYRTRTVRLSALAARSAPLRVGAGQVPNRDRVERGAPPRAVRSAERALPAHAGLPRRHARSPVLQMRQEPGPVARAGWRRWLARRRRRFDRATQSFDRVAHRALRGAGGGARQASNRPRRLTAGSLAPHTIRRQGIRKSKTHGPGAISSKRPPER